MTAEEREGLEMKLIFNDGYSHLREKPGRGICGLMHFIHTVALCYGVDETGYEGRYCFSNLREAMDSIDAWTGYGDPPGEWIKHKGRMEYGNERLIIQNRYMETGTKPKVIAVESLENGVLKYYGEGEYIGDLVPDKLPFSELGVANPCIKLDNGKYVWGFMCWWGNIEDFEKKFDGQITERIVADVPEEVGIHEKKEEL